MRSLDLFSCIGCHAIGFARAGIDTVAFCESHPARRSEIARQFPGVPIHDDVRKPGYSLGFGAEKPEHSLGIDIVIGGPPCQRTSVAAAISGHRTGESLWPEMLRVGINVGTKWFVVEQPPGNAAWEAQVSDDLSRAGFHVARFEFGACDVGAPYLRRRVFLVASACLPRLEIAWASVPSAIECVKRAANARGDWDPGKLATLPVDARAAGEFDRGMASAARRERIEALGDSNPPHMAEVIGRALKEAA